MHEKLKSEKTRDLLTTKLGRTAYGATFGFAGLFAATEVLHRAVGYEVVEGSPSYLWGLGGAAALGLTFYGMKDSAPRDTEQNENIES